MLSYGKTLENADPCQRISNELYAKLYELVLHHNEEFLKTFLDAYGGLEHHWNPITFQLAAFLRYSENFIKIYL